MKTKTIVISAGLLVLSGFASGVLFAQSGGHSNSTGHGSHGASTTPSEAGQSAFAAIAEITNLLAADPKTDWSKVNVTALRDHLVDMNALTLSAVVETVPDDKRVRFVAKGIGTTVRALQNMVPAHARELDKMSDWSAIGRPVNGGAELVITAENEGVRRKIEALGFFGMMATGAHHQQHHLAIAAGNPMH